jgi:hypothetical protein
VRSPQPMMRHRSPIRRPRQPAAEPSRLFMSAPGTPKGSWRQGVQPRGDSATDARKARLIACARHRVLAANSAFSTVKSCDLDAAPDYSRTCPKGGPRAECANARGHLICGNPGGRAAPTRSITR